MKGTAKAITNVKAVSGGGAINIMQVGDYAYGTPGSTDLMGFDHFYMKDGSLVTVGVPCKATLGNLVLTNEAEPTTPPVDPPVEPPVSEPVTVSVIVAGVSRFQAEYPAGTDVQINVK